MPGACGGGFESQDLGLVINRRLFRVDGRDDRNDRFGPYWPAVSPAVASGAIPSSIGTTAVRQPLAKVTVSR